MPSFHVPPEILLQIIDQAATETPPFHPDYRKFTLSGYALVNSTWTQVSQQLLWMRSIVLRGEGQARRWLDSAITQEQKYPTLSLKLSHSTRGIESPRSLDRDLLQENTAIDVVALCRELKRFVLHAEGQWSSHIFQGENLRGKLMFKLYGCIVPGSKGY